MPSTSTSTSTTTATTTTGASLLMADRATAASVLLGRTPIDRQLFAYEPTVAASTLSPIAIATTTTAPTSTLYDNFVSPLTSRSALGQQQLMADLAADLDHSTAPVATLYSFEDLGRWTSDSNCTALIHALLASFSVILVSELGDKTFIITAIMAMKNSRSLVFLSSASALLIMTILSVGMGVAATVIPELYTHYASIVLFLCFGLKMLKESYDMKDSKAGEESEFDEVKRSLEQDTDSSGTNAAMLLATSQLHQETIAPAATVFTYASHTVGNTGAKHDPSTVLAHQAPELAHSSTATATTTPSSSLAPAPAIEAEESRTSGERWYSKLVETLYIAPIVIKVFTMIFVAEWGDRSQISTVILAAREDVVGVFIGSLSGHIFCTGLAVIGGRFVADMISVRTMTLLGGIIFLFFAVFAILTGPEQSGG